MYIAFMNPQGNFDKADSYWTMHPDFGGQLVYVKEIASSLARMGHKIDIFTRKFNDERFPEFKSEFDFYDNIENLRIIRVPCGPDQFLSKEDLWPFLDEWTDNIIAFFESQNRFPDFVTGHYGDGGLSAAYLKRKKQIPYSFTAHSLGAQKLDKLFQEIPDFEDLENRYHFSKRILAERISIELADILFVSTHQESSEQYFHPLYADISQSAKVDHRFSVVPPGANTLVFTEDEKSFDHEMFHKIQTVLERDIDPSRIDYPYLVLASRLDPKKNHLGLLKAFASDPIIQKQSNVIISLRGIDHAFSDYELASSDEKEILDQMMKIIKDFDLYGKISFINIKSQQELSSFYRFMSIKRSAFVLTSLYEPFGLAPIEAMSSGLPAVVTKNGGPSEVLKEGSKEFGVLVDPTDPQDIAEGIHKLFSNYQFYKEQGKQRVLEKYTWDAAAKGYLKKINSSVKNNKIDFSFDNTQFEKSSGQIHRYLDPIEVMK